MSKDKVTRKDLIDLKESILEEVKNLPDPVLLDFSGVRKMLSMSRISVNRLIKLGLLTAYHIYAESAQSNTKFYFKYTEVKEIASKLGKILPKIEK